MTMTAMLKAQICPLYRVEISAATHHADGGAQASCHLHLVVFHHVGQQLPPLVAVRDGNGGDGGKPQVLQDTSQDDNEESCHINTGQL